MAKIEHKEMNGRKYVTVLVNPGELWCDSRALPYTTWIGTIDRASGRIRVWTPAARVPRGYHKAARAMLERVKDALGIYHAPAPAPRRTIEGTRAPSTLGSTWIESESVAYPSGAMVRRAWVRCETTGRYIHALAGIPDTFFSIPARAGKVRGFISIDSERGEFTFTRYRNQYHFVEWRAGAQGRKDTEGMAFATFVNHYDNSVHSFRVFAEYATERMIRRIRAMLNAKGSTAVAGTLTRLEYEPNDGFRR